MYKAGLRHQSQMTVINRSGGDCLTEMQHRRRRLHHPHKETEGVNDAENRIWTYGRMEEARL